MRSAARRPLTTAPSEWAPTNQSPGEIETVLGLEQRLRLCIERRAAGRPHRDRGGVMVADTAFYRYSHYHSQTDTPEKLNYPAMARVVTGLQRALGLLARQAPARTGMSTIGGDNETE